jgi:hypothetical protein
MRVKVNGSAKFEGFGVHHIRVEPISKIKFICWEGLRPELINALGVPLRSARVGSPPGYPPVGINCWSLRAGSVYTARLTSVQRAPSVAPNAI